MSFFQLYDGCLLIDIGGRRNNLAVVQTILSTGTALTKTAWNTIQKKKLFKGWICINHYLQARKYLNITFVTPISLIQIYQEEVYELQFETVRYM